MLLINSMIDYPNQVQNLVLPDGTNLQITFYFVPMQNAWFIRNLTYGTFVLSGIKVTNSPNILHQFRNQIPFGLACFSTNDREPQFQQDFSSGASVLYLLTAAEVKEYTDFLSAG